MELTRRHFLRSALATVAAPAISSSGALSAVEALANDLAAEAAALLQAQHDAILDSAFGESRLHMQLLNHWYTKGFGVTSMLEKVQDLQKRLNNLKERGSDLPELEQALKTAAESKDGEGVNIEQLEQMVAQTEKEATPPQTESVSDKAPQNTVPRPAELAL
ncbi:MAG TPA: hypothetical protein PLK85_05430 [Alphaproteobacteria bacterium]|nr:hypothetical protein [Alphaproteobacteria bacterium]